MQARDNSRNRKTFAASLAGLLLFCALPLQAATFTSSDEKFLLEFAPRWTAQETDSPENVLNLQSGGASFSISRMDENPDADQLRTLLQAELLALRSKGYAVPSEPKEFKLPSGPLLMYAVYLGGNEDIAAGFFNIGNSAFAISAVGMKEDELLRTMQTLHRPGEDLAQEPAQRKRRPQPKPAELPELPAAPAFPAPSSTAAINNLLGAALDNDTTEQAAQAPVPPTAAPAQEPPAKPGKNPAYPRRPLPLAPLAALLVLWAAGTIYASSRASKTPPPARVEPAPPNPPPDYNFPYALHATVQAAEQRFDFSGSDEARYSATANGLLDRITACAFYGLLAFEFAWSCLYMVGLDLSRALLPFPGGAYLASFPELIFAAVLAVGLILRMEQEHSLCIRDEQTNIVLEINGNRSEAQFKNSEGNLAGKLSKTPAGTWLLQGPDGTQALELRDSAPQLKPLRKLFGNLGGQLNARHIFQAGGRLAGAVVQSSANDADMTLEFSFSSYRAFRPDLIVAALLYVKSVERDYPYPWFF